VTSEASTRKREGPGISNTESTSLSEGGGERGLVRGRNGRGAFHEGKGHSDYEAGGEAKTGEVCLSGRRGGSMQGSNITREGGSAPS